MHALQQQYSNFVSVRQLLSSKFIIYVERIEKKRFFPICEFFFIEKSSDLCLNIFIESSKLLCEISRIFFSVPKKANTQLAQNVFIFTQFCPSKLKIKTQRATKVEKKHIFCLPQYIILFINIYFIQLNTLYYGDGGERWWYTTSFYRIVNVHYINKYMRARVHCLCNAMYENVYKL